MAIDIEVGYVAVHPLAHVVCEPANRKYVAGAVENETIFGVETLACLYFDGNRFEPWVVSAKTGNRHVLGGFCLHVLMIQNLQLH